MIETLNEITGTQWGYVQSRRKISYITSTEYKIKIGTSKRTADYVIRTKTYRDWKAALRIEICLALLNYLKKTNPTSPLIDRLKAEEISGVKVNDCLMDLNKCTEINTYQSTFVHADEWIKKELLHNNIEIPVVLSREDYI